MRLTRFRPAVRDRLRPCLAALALLAASAGAVVAQAVPAFAATSATLHVSPNGTGTACSTSQPCSLSQAKANVRAMNNSMTGDIVVEVADGTYRLTSPLTFTAADSGTGGYSVIWKAALGARPVITGAQRAMGWTLHDSAENIWQADVGTGFDTRQLYVDGFEADMAALEADPEAQEWWKLTDLCQEPWPDRGDSRQWTELTEIWHLSPAPGTLP